MKTLRELISEAHHQLYTYKHPDVTEVQQRLNEILEAAGEGGILRDKLDNIDIRDGRVYVSTSWSCRGCYQDGVQEFPEFLLDSEKPIRDATVWYLENKISSSEDKLVAYKACILSEERVLDTLKDELKLAKQI